MSSSRDSIRYTLALCAATLAVGLIAAPSFLSAQTRTSAVAPQSSSDRGVTIEVTPKSIGPGARVWEFSIQLHTHSSGVSDDLTQSAVLVTDDGRTFKPLGWSDTKLGPHREGLLSFEAPSPLPRAFELRITRPEEAAPRSFRWQL
ncbi:MAG TPA: hypothetical protein VFK10_19180 [Burkholderiaceae bacterium]|nr:hypothetical protein [Burkholderiaceae bacterium]